ncbi:MAG TPA: cell division protein ZapB [Thermoanaerobaculia bacterium]|nr:cell division protein ZapB [Thermoanaerobaculia bacterium]
MSDPEKAWLDRLEATVKEAAETIEALREEKADLVRQVQELEAKGGGDGGGEEAETAWRDERREIRKRVQKLTKRLEGLLEEAS